MLEVMSNQDKRIFWCLAVLWLVANVIFWSWWSKPEHIVSLPMFILMSASLFYETTFLPSVYLFYVSKMRKPIERKPHQGLRVAMITLCVPAKDQWRLLKGNRLCQKLNTS